MPLGGYSPKLTEHKPLDMKPSVICFPKHIFKHFLFFALLFSHHYYPVCKNWSFCNDASCITHTRLILLPLFTFWTCWLSSTKLNEGIEFLKLHKKMWIGREEQPYTGCHWRCALTSCLSYTPATPHETVPVQTLRLLKTHRACTYLDAGVNWFKDTNL